MPLQLFSSFPPVTGIRWLNLSVLVITPILSMLGFIYVPMQSKTAVAAFIYYIVTMLGITAGYHRLYSHRSYSACWPLKIFLVLAGTAGVQGSVYWWTRRHRSHHRYTDTDRDPYNSNRGLLWTHIGWMIFDTPLRPGPADITDLKEDKLLQWQHRWYFYLMFIFGYVLPTVAPGILWGDWLGGFCFVAALRLTICHHCTFCINSVAHWLGEASYDDKHSPRDHFISALLTMGEGYHNFHHQFPMDYRSSDGIWSYDPTKWFIAGCAWARLASDLKVFPKNEIDKGAFAMKLRELKAVQDQLRWPKDGNELEVFSWDEFLHESQNHKVIVVDGFVHDVSSFMGHHPGGSSLIEASLGKDVTALFFGGVYDHSNAALNVLSMMRVGTLSPREDALGIVAPPSQILTIKEAGPTTKKVGVRGGVAKTIGFKVE